VSRPDEQAETVGNHHGGCGNLVAADRRRSPAVGRGRQQQSVFAQLGAPTPGLTDSHGAEQRCT